MTTEPVEGDACDQEAASQRQRHKLAATGVLVVIVFTGAWIRALHLDERPLWVDEAESSINALTILQHGFPTDAYLGIPIYENTHVWPWPENSEYEFRDVSYSENHLAVYHGWLPLYAIAASFALHGIQPDQDDGSRSTKHSLTEQKHRTAAARIPSVLFAAVFLGLAFLGGNVLYGREAGWAALITAAYYPFHTSLSDQARYYSAQVTLTTACCILLWLLIRECRWKHVWLGGIAFVLLFHTHLLSFFTAVVMTAFCMPVIIHRHKDWLRKMLLFASIITAGTLPWIILTGFYQHQSRIPRAWSLLRIPADLPHYPPFNMWYAIPGLVIVIIALRAYLSRRRLVPDASIAAVRLFPVLLFLGGWTLVGYAAFLLFMPAVSFTKDRLSLSYWGPLFLLASTMSVVLVRIFTPRVSTRLCPILASLLMLLIFLSTGHSLAIAHTPGSGEWRVYTDIYQQLDSMHLTSTTKLYAAPNSHLVLSFYSGVPIQDITPVRKSYLDSYRGEIVYIEPEVSVETGILDPARVREAALRDGVVLSQDALEQTAIRLRTYAYRQSMMDAVAPVGPAGLEPLPAYARELLAAQRAQVSTHFANFGYELVTRGFEVRDWSDWCAVLKYRFVDPRARRGTHANFAERLRGADAMIVARSGTAAIYRSRWHPPHSTGSLSFRFVR
ncbi:glycosyltransferase family 39 protein [uncultured Paludibaculum sp.]|uniref:glycosyltransferase family 39 protein n=1 Tax=uncultured Paludibaculum sp. TaxID=1765020 RepID=UPI002AAC3CED|nr:glycosyltransferase family 39 protein [uncultured Paludibaculum sp.]